MGVVGGGVLVLFCWGAYYAYSTLIMSLMCMHVCASYKKKPLCCKGLRQLPDTHDEASKFWATATRCPWPSKEMKWSHRDGSQAFDRSPHHHLPPTSLTQHHIVCKPNTHCVMFLPSTKMVLILVYLAGPIEPGIW